MGAVCSTLCGDSGKNVEVTKPLTVDTSHHSLGKDPIKSPVKKLQKKVVSPMKKPKPTDSPHRLNSNKKDLDTHKMSIEDFLFHSRLGKGTFGDVILVTKKTNKQFYACKMLKKKNLNVNATKENVMTEKNVMKDANHPFIVKLHYSFQDSSTLYFIIDFVEGGELFKYLKKQGRFPENVASFYAAEVLQVFEYLHEKLDTIYRDQKPENVQLDKVGHIKLTDFGLSKIGEEVSYDFCGTPQYLAPEILDRKGHTKVLDFWTLGCLIYEMLHGYPVFDHQDQNMLFRLIKKQNPKFHSGISEDAKSIINGLLKKNPDERLGNRGISEIKSQPFFKNVNWERLLRRQENPPIRPEYKEDAYNPDKGFGYRPTPDNKNQGLIAVTNFTYEQQQDDMLRKQHSYSKLLL